MTEESINGKINCMLTKKDVEDLMIDSLGDFFEDVLVPYFDREHKENKKDHEKIRIELGDKIDLIDEHLKDHKRRISKLEDLASSI